MFQDWSSSLPCASSDRPSWVLRAYLSGFENDSDWQTQLWRFARGELTAEELHIWARDTTTRRSAREEDELVPRSSMPQAWWDAVHARYNQRLLNLSAPSTEVAVLLDWTSLSDVDYLIGENRMVSYDVYGVERVPTWQVYDAGTLDGRWELLPGLDLVIAAAPEELIASERLTMWMTTSDDFLYLDGVPSTPTDWLIGGQPLRTVVAAMHGRR
jgi:hypothetical protein